MMAEQRILRLTCREVIGLMVDYLEATLTMEHVEAFERHLQACPACVAYLNTYRKTQELTAAEGAVEMPDDMRQRLRDLLEEQFRRGGGV